MWRELQHFVYIEINRLSSERSSMLHVKTFYFICSSSYGDNSVGFGIPKCSIFTDIQIMKFCSITAGSYFCYFTIKQYFNKTIFYFLWQINLKIIIKLKYTYISVLSLKTFDRSCFSMYQLYSSIYRLAHPSGL